MEENKMEENKTVKNKMNAKAVGFIGVLGALSALLMLFDFPLFFAPSFIKFDVSDIPELFAAYFMGPAAGCLTALVKVLLNLVMNGSTTACVGELTNLCGSCFFILLASLPCRRENRKETVTVGLLIAVPAVSLFYVLLNAKVMFPLYGKIYGMSMDVIVKAAAAVNPLVHDMFSMMFFSILPFNLLKYTVQGLITVWIYGKAEKPLRRIVK